MIVKKVPLRYFLGVLFENFKLIWEPLTDLIHSYVTQLKPTRFWAIFGEHLTHISAKIGKLIRSY